MEAIETLDVERKVINDGIEFDVVDYTKKIFRMFSGDTENVKLQFDNSLINVVIDRFGKDINIKKMKDDTFLIEVDVVATNTFLSWLFMFGDKVKIVEPIVIRDRFTTCVKEVLESYR